MNRGSENLATLFAAIWWSGVCFPAPENVVAGELEPTVVHGALVNERSDAVVGAHILQVNSSGGFSQGGPTDGQGKFQLKGHLPHADSAFRVTLPDGLTLEATETQVRPLMLRVSIDPIRIQGIWRVKSKEVGGVKTPEALIRNSRIAITGDAMLMDLGAADVEHHDYVMDARNRPATFDVTRNHTTRGIYELSDTELKLCFSNTIEHPTRFASEPDTNHHTLLKLRPESPVESTKRIDRIELPENQGLRAKLLTRASVDFRQEPLSAAMEFLSKISGITIRLDADAPRDTPISINMDAPVHSILEVLLAPIGIEYNVKNGEVVVSSAD